MLRDLRFFAENVGFVPCYWRNFETSPTLDLLVRRESFCDQENSGSTCHEDFYALYIVRGGQGTHIIDGHPYAMTRGDVYIMPPGTIHQYRDYRNYEGDAFYFLPSLFHEAELEALRALRGFWKLFVHRDAKAAGNANHVGEQRFHLSPEHQTQVEVMVAEIRAEITASSEGLLLARQQFFRLLVWLARWHVRHETVRSGGSNVKSESLAGVLRLCEERFQESLSVPQLAAHMFLSPSRFTAIFTQEMGVPPATYLRRLRLERAQTLLRTTADPVAEVANQSGFTDATQLTRSFRVAFHTTPSAYRAAFQSASARIR